MAVDLAAIGSTSGPTRHRWDSTASILYALGVGAGTGDLALTTENSDGITQQALPTMAIVVAATDPTLMDRVGHFDPATIVHGGQELELHVPFPVSGEVECTSKIVGIFDKGSGAVVVVETKSVDTESRTPAFTTRATAFVRGAGGFGGDRGPPSNIDMPDRPADAVIDQQTRPDQALLYRLSGDRNPLHSDPTFAARAGFDVPILHGLCTFGFAARGLLRELLAGDVTRVQSIAVRFSAPVLPGDSLRTEAWSCSPEELRFLTRRGDGTVVLDGGRLMIRTSSLTSPPTRDRQTGPRR
jgi:acyl dehydratase